MPEKIPYGMRGEDPYSEKHISLFSCNFFLGENSSFICDPTQGTIEKLPVRKKSRCLVCGDGIDVHQHSFACRMGCGYRAHKQCVVCISAVLCRSECADDEFSCSFVEFQLRPEEVVQMSNAIGIEELRRKLRLRGKVNTAKYSVTTKRWRNEEINCRKCHRWYGLNEQDHHLNFCLGILGTPPPSVKLRMFCPVARGSVT